MCQEGVEKKKKCQGAYIFYIGIPRRFRLGFNKNIPCSKFGENSIFLSLCTRNFEEMVLFSAIKCKSLLSDDVKNVKIWS